MKKYFPYNNFALKVSIILFFFINKTLAQYSIAGIQGQVYVDIIPDTLLFPQPQTNVQSNEIYSIDINQDGINDIKIDAIVFYGNVISDERIDVSSLNSYTSFINGGYQDTTWWNPPDTTISNSSTLKMFNYGDTIQDGIFNSSGWLARRYVYTHPFGGTSYMTKSSFWINAGDKYFGVKYEDSSGVYYGWVKINVTGYFKVLIEEFSLGTPATAINSITAFNNLICIYPNPATDKFFIQTNSKIKSITAYNVQGEKIYSKGNPQNEIDFSNQEEGVYFLQIKTEQSISNKKIIINR